MWFRAILSRKKQVDNYECSCFLGPEYRGNRWTQSHFLKQLILLPGAPKIPRLVAAELAVSTATCRHSTHRSKALQTSQFPPQDAVLTQGVPAQQIHLWREEKPKEISQYDIWWTLLPFLCLLWLPTLWAIEFRASLLHQWGLQVKKFHTLPPAYQIIYCHSKHLFCFCSIPSFLAWQTLKYVPSL